MNSIDTIKSLLYRRRGARGEDQDQIPLLPLRREGSSTSSPTSLALPSICPSVPASTLASTSASASPSANKPRLALIRAINHLRRNAHGAFTTAAVLPCCPAYVAVQLATFGL
ncbi:hypothetical protein E4U55_007748 [Claviceps digitariae]|nr:hypothetical protein E4U55_007748 [Claviceps digitariae]